MSPMCFLSYDLCQDRAPACFAADAQTTTPGRSRSSCTVPTAFKCVPRAWVDGFVFIVKQVIAAAAIAFATSIQIIESHTSTENRNAAAGNPDPPGTAVSVTRPASSNAQQRGGRHRLVGDPAIVDELLQYGIGERLRDGSMPAPDQPQETR